MIHPVAVDFRIGATTIGDLAAAVRDRMIAGTGTASEAMMIEATIARMTVGMVIEIKAEVTVIEALTGATMIVGVEIVIPGVDLTTDGNEETRVAVDHSRQLPCLVKTTCTKRFEGVNVTQSRPAVVMQLLVDRPARKPASFRLIVTLHAVMRHPEDPHLRKGQRLLHRLRQILLQGRERGKSSRQSKTRNEG
jgi:hypothetical protein